MARLPPVVMLARRALVGSLALLAAVCSMPPYAQAPATRIGYLGGGMTPADGSPPAPLRRALFDLGYGEGRIVYIARWADVKQDRLPALARDIVDQKPDVIVTVGHPSAQAAKTATRTIPIVAAEMGDPVASGLVESLGRPGGNVTGVSDQSAELSAKRVELLKEMRPDATRIAVLWNARNEAMTQRYREIERAGSALHVAVEPFSVRSPEDLDAAFQSLARSRPDALLVVTDAITNANVNRLVEFAEKANMPTMYEFGPIVRFGGLMSYGPPSAYTWHGVADYVDRIVRGAKPSDLPIEQPKEYELVLNLRTAKALGIVVPQSVLQRATDLVR